MLKLIYRAILVIWMSTLFLAPGQVKAQSTQPISVWRLSLEEFISTVEKTPTTILGGCVSITESAISLSVMIMALEVSKAHEKNEVRIKAIDSINQRLRVFEDSLKKAADYDNVIYRRFLAAYKLPGGTRQQIAFKDSVIYATSLDATESPLNAARIMVSTLELMGKSIAYCSHITKSDGLASATLLKGAVDAILQLADTDIAALKENDQQGFIYELKQYNERSAALLDEIKKTAARK